MIINPAKLVFELLAAGLPTIGARATGTPVADYSRALTPAEQATAAAVIAAHDPVEVPVPSLDERIAELEKRNKALEAALVKASVLSVAQIDAEAKP